MLNGDFYTGQSAKLSLPGFQLIDCEYFLRTYSEIRFLRLTLDRASLTGRGDHTIDDVVIIPYPGITANDALLKNCTGTNIDTSPQYRHL